MRVLHASPTWFSPESVVGGGERWVDNVMAALAAGAPEIKQAMIGSVLNLASYFVVGSDPDPPKRASAGGPDECPSSRLWSEFDVRRDPYPSVTDRFRCVRQLRRCVTWQDGRIDGSRRGCKLDMLKAVSRWRGLVSISRYAHSFIAPLSAPLGRS